MKKLLLLLLYTSFAQAQVDFTKIYHPIINEAELAIVDTNYHEALQFYNEAFANVNKPFAKDYYNAAICATLIGKMPIAFDFLEKIVEKGYPADSLRRDNFFKLVADTCKKWNDFEKHARLIKPNLNHELRDTLRNMQFSKYKPVYTPLTAELRKFYKENIKEKWVRTDSLLLLQNMPENLLSQRDSIAAINTSKEISLNKEIIKKTIQIIELYGFPDENMIGLNQYLPGSFNRWGYRKENNSYFLESTYITEILSFNYQDSIDIIPIVKQAIRQGKIPPNTIQKLINYSTNEPCTMGRVNIFQLRLENNLNCDNLTGKDKTEKWFWKKERSATLSEYEINERRQSLGLEKLEDAYRKAFFKANPTPFIIYGGSYQSELSYIASCDGIDKLIKDTIVIK